MAKINENIRLAFFFFLFIFSSLLIVMSNYYFFLLPFIFNGDIFHRAVLWNIFSFTFFSLSLKFGYKKRTTLFVILSLCTEIRYIFIFLLHRNKHIHLLLFHHMLLYPAPSVFHRPHHDVPFLLSGEFHTQYATPHLHT